MSAKKNNEIRETLTAESGGQGSVKVESANSDGFTGRMRALVKALGSIAEIARKSGISESTIKNWVDGVSDPSRERCLMLARGTGASLVWLVAGEGPMWAAETVLQSQSPALRREDLMLALKLAEEALEGKTLPTDKRAELVTLIYELLEEGLPEAKVLRFARAAA